MDDQKCTFTALQLIAEEFPLGVSVEQVTNTLNGLPSSATETVNLIRKAISTNLNEELKNAWQNYNVEEKLQALRSSEVTQQKLNYCQNSNLLKLKYLQEQKQELQNKMTKKKTEMAEVEKYLQNRVLIIKDLKEKLMPLIND